MVTCSASNTSWMCFRPNRALLFAHRGLCPSLRQRHDWRECPRHDASERFSYHITFIINPESPALQEFIAQNVPPIEWATIYKNWTFRNITLLYRGCRRAPASPSLFFLFFWEYILFFIFVCENLPVLSGLIDDSMPAMGLMVVQLLTLWLWGPYMKLGLFKSWRRIRFRYWYGVTITVIYVPMKARSSMWLALEQENIVMLAQLKDIVIMGFTYQYGVLLKC